MLAPGRAEPARGRQLAEGPVAVPVEDGSAYASLMVEEAEGPNALLLWRCRWHGRILAWRLPCGTIYIGPHWYFSIVMLGFIVGVGAFHVASVKRTSRLQLLGGIVVTFLSSLTFLRCALSDPGVLRPSPATVSVAPEEGVVTHGLPGQRRISRVSPGGSVCTECKLVQPRGCSHCEFCQVCIEGFDHHCPWMGKCIGKDNVCAFYTFIAVAFSSLAYIFLIALLGPPTSTQRAATLPFRPTTPSEVVHTL